MAFTQYTVQIVSLSYVWSTIYLSSSSAHVLVLKLAESQFIQLENVYMLF